MSETKAPSVIDRLKQEKKPEDALIENGQFIQTQKGEMFKLKSSELSELIRTNPSHPVAAAYRKAVVSNGPNEDLIIEKIDAMALIENREVKIEYHEEEVEVEGVKGKTRVQIKKLGDVLKGNKAAPSIAPDSSPNQPSAQPTISRQK